MGKQRVVISSGDLYGGQDMVTKRITATVTRPNNTAQYTAGDVVGNSTQAPITFSDVTAQNGGAGIILDALAICSAAQSTKPNLRLYLFDGTTFVTTAADNGAWAPTDAQMKFCIGWAEFSSWETGSGNIVARADGLNIPFECISSGRGLVGVSVERSTYTPAGADAFTYRLGVIRG